jgi:hypothetical protein
MRSLFLSFSSILFMGFLSLSIPVDSFADSQSAPAWISGSSEQYSSTQYLVGVGDSPSQERAKDKARADLVKTIQVKIDASSNLKERVSAHETRGGVEEDILRTSVNDIKTSSQVEMKNIRIAETWYNEKTENYFALAVLSRVKASADLSLEMRKFDEETSRHMSRSEETRNKLDQIAFINKAIESQQHRQILSNYLLAIDSAASELDAKSYDIDTLRNQAKNIQRQLPLSVNVTGDDVRSLALYTKGALAALGYTAVSSRNAQYVIDVHLQKQPALYKDDLYWVFANLEIKLRDALTQNVLGTCSWEFKEASQYKDRAGKNVLQAVKEVFTSEFNHVFNAFINAEQCKSLEY